MSRNPSCLACFVAKCWTQAVGEVGRWLKVCSDCLSPLGFTRYGVDIIITRDLRPQLLEVTFAPDCSRAVKTDPHFYDKVGPPTLTVIQTYSVLGGLCMPARAVREGG
jgi:hypothetical protein